MGDAPVVQARRIHDCVWKVRIHYQLPAPLNREFVRLFQDSVCEVQEFSKIVAGAKDLLTVRLAGRFHVVGILGDTSLVAIFGKSLGEWPARDIADFESRLTQAGYGQVVNSRPDEIEELLTSLETDNP